MRYWSGLGFIEPVIGFVLHAPVLALSSMMLILATVIGVLVTAAAVDDASAAASAEVGIAVVHAISDVEGS